MSNIFDLFQKISSSQNKTTGPITHLVVGLGNPGPKYEGTRHNAGFICLDTLAKQENVSIVQSKYKSLVAPAQICGVNVLLMKPQTLMNLSGEAVSEAARFYKIAPENIIVICDDVSFDVGHVRIRLKGSHGGHNGLRNIQDRLSSDQYIRIKVGVGKKPTPEYDLANWVLGTFPKEDKEKLQNTVAPGVGDAIRLILQGKADEAMNRYSK